MADCEPLLTTGLTEIRAKIRQAPGLSVFLDFDGTLAPIVDDPTTAQLEKSTRKLLTALATRPDILMVIVSGRALSDLQTRIGIEGIVYAGNHGLEISGKGMRFVEPFAAARQGLLSQISDSLRANLSGIAGARVENKGLTATVHYRQATPNAVPDIERIVRTVVAPDVSAFLLHPGRMVLEVIPRGDWHKGAAVCWIHSRLSSSGAVLIYAGDDRTDETAFRQLTGEITVFVGSPGNTAARYHVPDPAGVCEFLAWLIQERSRRAAS